MEYEGDNKGGHRGVGGVPSYRLVSEATGYHKNTIKKWVETAKAAGGIQAAAPHGAER